MPPRLLACTMALAALASASSHAQNHDARPSWYVQASRGDASSYALVAGTTIPWQRWSSSFASGQVRGHWDVWAGAWSNRDNQHERFNTPAIGIGPSVRWRAAQGTSPWFLEAGTAIMLTGKHLYNSGQRMGTRWNFASHIGVGMNFGPRHAHAVTVRIQHASNAGIKRPNPGLNFVQLRYARSF